MAMLLGCVADDFTGATDLANTLAKEGLRTIFLNGVPRGTIDISSAEAVVVAIKSRTAPVEAAVSQSLAVLAYLRAAGAGRIFFKYCSTFDSTAAGNIGPVTDALLGALGSTFTVVCPAFPETGRTIYMGYLFVNGIPLAESHMRHHPLTPMTDSSLPRLMTRQSAGQAGLVAYPTIAAGEPAIRSALQRLPAEGKRYAIVDALLDKDLLEIGRACSDLPLVTGASGMAMGLAADLRRRHPSADSADATRLEKSDGLSAVLAGSCSAATLAQVEHMKRRWPALAIDPLKLAAGKQSAAAAVAWAAEKLQSGPVLIYSSAAPEVLKAVQAKLPPAEAGRILESAMAQVAAELVKCGVRRLVVAGGETAGAVVAGLGIRALRIGPQIDPGVPWTMSLDQPRVFLALKSGNFGSVEFFTKALEVLR